MDEVEKRVLSQMRTKLIKEMVVTESFLSAFCHSNVLDDSMSSILKSERNYEQRAGKLLDLLPSRGSKAFLTLMEILEITNPWLSEKMRAALHDERNRDAKINLHPSVSKSASIEGFGESRLHIDVDIKERAAKYVRTNLYHLTEAEQRGVDKWLADELQRERRRQQFRAPHKMPRDPRDFHASKECQTETSVMDMRDIYEEMTTYLHGVDAGELITDIGFGMMQEQIRELLSRTRKLDALFLNCLNKFDDSDKYTLTLPELIDKSVHHEKDLQLAETDNKKAIQKSREENEALKRHVRRLEEHVDRLIQRQTQGMRPQEIQLRHRQDVHFRYTLPAPADSGHFAVNRKLRAGTDADDERDWDECNDYTNDDNMNYKEGHDQVNYSSSNMTSNTCHNNPENTKAAPCRVGGDSENRANANTRDVKRKSSIDFSHHTSLKNVQTYVTASGQKIHKAETVHYEDNNINPHQNNWKNNSKAKVQTVLSSHNEQQLKNNLNEYSVFNDNSPINNDAVNEPSLKIRRHASEESIRLAVAQESYEITSTTALDGANADHPSRRNSLDNSSQSAMSPQQKKQPSLQQNHNAGVDLKARVQRMVSERVYQHQNQQRRGSRDESERYTSGSGLTISGDVSIHAKSNSKRYRDSSPAFKGNHNLRISYEDKDKHQTRALNKNNSSSNESTDKGLMQQQHIQFHQNQTFSHNSNHQPVPYPEPPQGRQHHEHFSRGHPRYRSTSSDRGYHSAQSNPSLTVVSPGSHSPEYLSDSELVMKKSSLRGKTVRSDKSRARVRFATPVVKSIPPQRKISARTHRAAHYQMDTASTASRKTQNMFI